MQRVLKGLVLALVLMAFVGFSYEQIGRWRHGLAACLDARPPVDSCVVFTFQDERGAAP
jgi:hypothetical protein